MADKVQFILQDVLQDALFMVRKGVFSQGQLQQQMKRREHFEHALTKSTQKTTDYLKAIQYQYEQERIRRYREEHTEEFKIDPKYKKTDSRDFTIVKRAIRLWDRAMHKFRYRIDLWKQYLAFCYVIKSKKTFYKALSNAVKFNPFSLELWLSGVFYQFEVNKNPWKARKVFHKALKINRTNLEFWTQYLRFELMFTQVILERQSHIIKDQEGMQIIGITQHQEEKEIQIEQQIQNKKKTLAFNFINLLKTVVEQGLNAIENSQQKQTLMKKIIEVLKDQTLSPLLNQTKQQIIQHIQQLIQDKNILMLTEEENFKHLMEINYKKQYKKLKARCSIHKLTKKLELVKFFYAKEKSHILRNILVKELDVSTKESYYLRWSEVMVSNNKIQQDTLNQIIRELCLRKKALAEILEKIIEIDPSIIFRKLINAKIIFPASLVAFYLDRSKDLNLSKIQLTELMKRVDEEFLKEVKYVKCLAQFNKRVGDTQANLKLIQRFSKGSTQDRQTAVIIAQVMNQ